MTRINRRVGMGLNVSIGARRNQACPCGSGKKFKLCCIPLAAVHATHKASSGLTHPGAAVSCNLCKTPTLRDMGQKPEHEGPGLILCMPSRGRVTVETMVALAHLDGFMCSLLPKPRLGIEQARNELAEAALRVSEHARFRPTMGWFVLWVDDDAFWKPGTILEMMKRINAPKTDIIAGYFSARAPYTACVAWYDTNDQVRPGVNCEEGELVEVDRVGFHFVLHKLEVLEKLGPNPFTIEGSGEKGEDLAFCRRARQAGLHIRVHTGCPVAHVADDGVCYLPGVGPHRVNLPGAQLIQIVTERNYDGPPVAAEASSTP